MICPVFVARDPDFLRQHWGMPASYVIAAYNDMAKVRDPAGGVALLIGLEVFIPLQAQLAAGTTSSVSDMAASKPRRR